MKAPAPTEFALDCLCASSDSSVIAQVTERFGAKIRENEIRAKCPNRFLVSSGPRFPFEGWKNALFEAASSGRFDVLIRARAARPAGPFESIRLLVMDVDSTVIENEIIDELAREKGVGDQIREITERAMRGELDFKQSLTERVSRLAGLSEAGLAAALSRIRFSKGAEALISAARGEGCRTVLVSGGFHFAVDRLQERLGVDRVFANRLEIVGGHLTGKVSGDILDAAAKARHLENCAAAYGVDLKNVLAVGDGANDALMLKKAGVAVGFRPKPVLWGVVDGVVMSGDLASLIPVLAGG